MGPGVKPPPPRLGSIITIIIIIITISRLPTAAFHWPVARATRAQRCSGRDAHVPTGGGSFVKPGGSRGSQAHAGLGARLQQQATG